MSFAEGFAGGFGMVDAALNRRELMAQREREMATENARYTDNVTRDEKRYQEGKDRQGQLDKQNVDWHNESKARQDKLDEQAIANTNREYALKEQDMKNDAANRQASLSLQRAQVGLHAAQVNSQMETDRLQRQYMTEQKDREQATLRAQSLFATDPTTGLTTLNLTPGNELNDLKDIQTAYGVNVANVARDLPKMQQHVSTIKAALVNPALFQQNKGAVLQALNEIEGHDINKGLGAYDGTNADLQGGHVVKKEISDIFPSPDGRGFVFNVKTYVEKDGKTYTDEGPMTQYRSSNPADNQIRVIGAYQIIQRLDGYDALNKTLQANPQFVNAINSLTAKKGKGEKDHYEKVTSEKTGEDGMTKTKKTLLYNTDKGTVIDPEAKLSDQNDAATLINARKNSGANRGPSLFDAQTAPANTQSQAPTQAPPMDEARRLVQSPYQRADNR
jgi:hypothetical protein